MAWTSACSHHFAEIDNNRCNSPKTRFSCGFSLAKATVTSIGRYTRRLCSRRVSWNWRGETSFAAPWGFEKQSTCTLQKSFDYLWIFPTGYKMWYLQEKG